MSVYPLSVGFVYFRPRERITESADMKLGRYRSPFRMRSRRMRCDKASQSGRRLLLSPGWVDDTLPIMLDERRAPDDDDDSEVLP
jgi:hypothetical protein